MVRGRTEEARAILDDVIGRSRTAIGSGATGYGDYLQLGRALLVRGNLDEAIAEFRQSLRLKPDHANGHNNLGVALRERGRLDEAVAEFREAVRLKPGDDSIHNELGITLKRQGSLDQAIAEFHEVIRLKPDHALAHNNIGVALREKGRLDEAIAEFRETLRLSPGNPLAHTNLGVALGDQGKFDEAIAEHRTALRLKPNYVEAHINLGEILRSFGRYAESLAEFRTARDLVRQGDPGLGPLIEEGIALTERQASLSTRLLAALAGRLGVVDAIETLGFAQLCYGRKLHGASARLWCEAFRSQPKLADDMQAQHRYNAACAAALAGCGRGRDDPPLDEAAKVRWRKQAIAWLEADLAAWSKTLNSAPPQARPSIAKTLQHWKADTDLAGLRDPGSLAKFPKDEQDTCRALWKDVDALLAKAGSGAR